MNMQLKCQPNILPLGGVFRSVGDMHEACRLQDLQFTYGVPEAVHPGSVVEFSHAARDEGRYSFKVKPQDDHASQPGSWYDLVVSYDADKALLFMVRGLARPALRRLCLDELKFCQAKLGASPPDEVEVNKFEAVYVNFTDALIREAGING